MKRSVVVVLGVLALAGVGCDDGGGNPVHDMAMDLSQPDGPTSTPIGGVCTTNSDCQIGMNPKCYIPRTKPGICVADCFTDTDCGDGNVCLFAPSSPSGSPGACARACQASSDCESGSGCWVTLDKIACWPLNGVTQFKKPLTLDCDPKVAGCSFAGSTLPGGCERQVLGDGTAGHCFQGCDIGVGTCPDTPDGALHQSCYFVDETVDSTGMLTGDALKQNICIFAAPVLPQGANPPTMFIPDGELCQDPADPTDSAGMPKYFFDICNIGSECETFVKQGAATPADNKCHQLCYLAGYTPPDPGSLPLDGGIAMACPNGTTCNDVWGLASASAPTQQVGLCK